MIDWELRQQRTAESYGAYLRHVDRPDAPLAVLQFGQRCGHPTGEVRQPEHSNDPLDIPAFLKRGA